MLNLLIAFNGKVPDLAAIFKVLAYYNFSFVKRHRHEHRNGTPPEPGRWQCARHDKNFSHEFAATLG